MKVTYDKLADAMYISFARGEIKKTVQVNPRVLVDVGKNGKVIAVELLFVSEKMPKSDLRPKLRHLLAAVR
mgnify:CR=1 FL=1